MKSNKTPKSDQSHFPVLDEDVKEINFVEIRSGDLEKSGLTLSKIIELDEQGKIEKH